MGFDGVAATHTTGAMVLLLLLLIPVHAQDAVTESKVASQCIRENSLAFLSLYCGFQRQIRIDSAVHGAHKTVTDECMQLDEDCTVSSMSDYDWDGCEDKHSCVITLKPQDNMVCGEAEKQVYLQISYSCIPVVVTTTVPPPPTTELLTTTPSPRHRHPTDNGPKSTTPAISRVDICSNQSLSHVSVLEVTSPGFPGQLPGSQECRCDVIGQPGKLMTLQIHTVSLGMHKGLCHDWLKIDFPSAPGNQLVACGQQKHGEKVLQLMKPGLGLHLHTARGMHPQHLKGFHLALTAGENSYVKVHCYKMLTKPDNEGKVLAPTDLNSLPRDKPKTANHQSNGSSRPSSLLSTIIFPLLLVKTYYYVKT